MIFKTFLLIIHKVHGKDKFFQAFLLFCDSTNRIGERRHIVLTRKASEAHTDRRARRLRRAAHRTQDVGWVRCPRTARTAARYGKAREIQTDEQRILWDVPYAKAQDARQPLLSVPVKSNAVDVRKCGAQLLSRSALAHILCAHLRTSNRRRTAAADDPRDILRARAHIAFLCAAI